MTTRLFSRFLGLSLFACASMAWGQNTVQPYKLAIYQDAARISYKGVISFMDQRADVPMDFHVDANGMDLNSSGTTKIQYYRVRVDSISKRMPVADWTDVLRANISKKVTVVYQIGQEFDEVSGDAKYINETAGLLLLQATSGSEFFIPLSQIKQVVIGSGSEYNYSKRVPVDILEVGIDADVPSLPLELSIINNGLNWSPMCRLRILGSNKARLQVQALVENQLADFKDVEIELNPGSLLTRSSGMAAEPRSGGKLSIRKGDRLILNLQDLELEYENNFRFHQPWTGLKADGKTVEQSAENTLRLALPSNTSFSCEELVIVDEHNRQVASISGSEQASDGSMTLLLGKEDNIKVSISETEIKRDGKAVKIGESLYEKVSVEGKITCQNLGQKYAQLQLSREFVGEATDTGKGTLSASPTADSQGSLSTQTKLLSWKISVDKGQKKEFVFRYDAWVPKK